MRLSISMAYTRIVFTKAWCFPNRTLHLPNLEEIKLILNAWSEQIDWTSLSCTDNNKQIRNNWYKHKHSKKICVYLQWISVSSMRMIRSVACALYALDIRSSFFYCLAVYEIFSLAASCIHIHTTQNTQLFIYMLCWSTKSRVCVFNTIKNVVLCMLPLPIPIKLCLSNVGSTESSTAHDVLSAERFDFKIPRQNYFLQQQNSTNFLFIFFLVTSSFILSTNRFVILYAVLQCGRLPYSNFDYI